MTAYTELCELAQRKFVQQLAVVASRLKGSVVHWTTPYPRLCFVDLADDALERLNASGGGVSLLSLTPADLVMRMMCEVEGVSSIRSARHCLLVHSVVAYGRRTDHVSGHNRFGHESNAANGCLSGRAVLYSAALDHRRQLPAMGRCRRVSHAIEATGRWWRG